MAVEVQGLGVSALGILGEVRRLTVATVFVATYSFHCSSLFWLTSFMVRIL